MRDIYNGTRQYPFPTPIVPGSMAIGRVAALGPDAVSLSRGQLVFLDLLIRGRDDPSQAYLMGIHQGRSAGTVRLMRDVYRDSTFAEYVRAPLENLHPLDEARLLGDPSKDPLALGYKAEELGLIGALSVAFGGLRDVGVTVGETVLVAPATGQFGGAAVVVALGMGAGKVIVMGRDEAKLAKLKARDPRRVETAVLRGSAEEMGRALSEHGSVDVYYDVSPAVVGGNAAHMKAGIRSMAHGGRVSLMGGIMEDVAIPHREVMTRDLTIKGKFMYERKDLKVLIKMLETGMVKLGEQSGSRVVGTYGLDQVNEALDHAAEGLGNGEEVVVVP